jgi:hypothetical protein
MVCMHVSGTRQAASPMLNMHSVNFQANTAPKKLVMARKVDGDIHLLN